MIDARTDCVGSADAILEENSIRAQACGGPPARYRSARFHHSCKPEGFEAEAQRRPQSPAFERNMNKGSPGLKPARPPRARVAWAQRLARSVAYAPATAPRMRCIETTR